MSSLHQAAKSGNVSELKNHLSDVNVNLTNEEDAATPLYLACENGHLDVVKTLLNTKGINVNLANKRDWTPLQVAAYYGYPQIVEQLLTRDDIRIYATDRLGNNVLHFCIDGKSENRLETVRYILRYQREKLPDTKTFVELQKNNKKISPFYCACFNGLLDTTRVILEETTQKNECLFHRNGTMDSTGFAICCYYGFLDVAKLLLQEADELMRIQDSYGYTPLIDAIRQKHHNIVEYLVPKLSALDLERQAEDKKTALHFGVELDLQDVMRMILRNPYLNINIADKDGETPLHYAAKRSGDSVKLLLSYRRIEEPDLSLENNEGKTAIQIAEASKNPEAAQYLQTHEQCPLWVMKHIDDIHSVISAKGSIPSSFNTYEQEILKKIMDQRGEKRKMDSDGDDGPQPKQRRLVE